ncbi:MAG: glycosyltransferase family 39 protein [Candidatus Sumerlaeota bacterium]|nr:glycosyltransferase family 39 protein [Candidatus Sumerlaeota bacterium]
MPSRSAFSFEARWVAALSLAAAVLYSAGMVRNGFEGKDERRYAQVAKELSRGSGLIVLHNLGKVYPDKPPLFFWLEGISFRVFGGISPFAARVPLFFLALAALAFSYLFMRQIDGPREALLGTAALALCFRFFWEGRWVKLDVPMCGFLFGSFWASARILFPKPGQPPAGARWAYGAWFFAALAVLTKGPGAAVWLGSLLTYAAARRDWSVMRRHRWASGLALLGVICMAWLGPAMWLGGPKYREFLISPRVIYNLVGEHDQPFYYFSIKLLTDGLPMSLLLPAALWRAWRIRRRPEDGGRAAFLLSVVGFTLVFFSIPLGKRGQYILPLYPAACLLTARFFVAALSDKAGKGRVALRRHLWGAGALLAGAGVGALFVRHGVSKALFVPPPLSVRLGLFLALAGGAAAVWAASWKRKEWRAAGACGASLFAAYVLLFELYFPLCYDDSTSRGVAERVAQVGGAEAPMALLGIDDRYTLYGATLPRILSSHDAVREFMAGGPNRWLAIVGERYGYYVRDYGKPDWEEMGRWKEIQRNLSRDILLFRSK